jgi:N-acetylmuramic acid 6-phosphate etherase
MTSSDHRPLLKTETPSDRHRDLDTYGVEALVDALVDDQAHAAAAVRAARRRIADAVEAAVPRISAGGRLVYVGAGTSGRLGMLDGVELEPTFSWPPSRVVAVLAGGRRAMFGAVEGAEDSAEQGAADVRAAEVGPNDVVIGIAASGTTPFVIGALEAAWQAGALTIAIANNPDVPLTRAAQIAVTLDTGSEVISGSTRLKAGTAQKIALNTLSSAIMVRLHKVYGNLMVDLHPTNHKLHRRAVAMTMRATGCDEAAARRALEDSGHRVKVAVVSLLGGIGIADAETRLAAADGSVRDALAGRP